MAVDKDCEPVTLYLAATTLVSLSELITMDDPQPTIGIEAWKLILKFVFPNVMYDELIVAPCEPSVTTLTHTVVALFICTVPSPLWLAPEPIHTDDAPTIDWPSFEYVGNFVKSIEYPAGIENKYPPDPADPAAVCL